MTEEEPKVRIINWVDGIKDLREEFTRMKINEKVDEKVLNVFNYEIADEVLNVFKYYEKQVPKIRIKHILKLTQSYVNLKRGYLNDQS